MPDELFIQVTGEDGVVTYQPLSEASVDDLDVSLPEQLIRSHELFQTSDNDRRKAIQESKRYRKRAQAAEAALHEDEPEEDDNADEQPDPPTPQQPLNEDAMFERFMQRINEEAQQREDANLEKANKIKKLIHDHKLATIEGIEVILANSTNPEETARTLGTQAMRFGGGSGGETDYKESMDDNDKVLRMLGMLPDNK